MPNLFLVMIGGAVGAGLRYEVGRLALARAGAGAGFPWGTLAVNLSGGLFIGLLAGAMGGGGDRPVWLLLAVGLLGGFTTFSAFSLDMFAMLERGAAGLALAYAIASVLGALLLLACGWWIGRAAA